MNNNVLEVGQLAQVLDKVPAGITVIDSEWRILYYNEYCGRYVDRRPEYLGESILSCHKKGSSIDRIKQMLSSLAEGKQQEVYYETQRGDTRLAVTVVPFRLSEAETGFIQTFTVLK